MGEAITVRLPEALPAGLPLSDWLEGAGHTLNTRCGGRGICRGCRVEADGESVRACQTPAKGVSEVWIPGASRRDRRLSGVSFFELGGAERRPRLRTGLGLALDLGTTTVAGALWDLRTGRCLAHGARANEQRRYGDNVLSRIDHASGGVEGGRQLQEALVVGSIVPLVCSLCERAGVDMGEITEAVAAGNTIMQHSLVAASLKGFGAYPFRPVFLDRREVAWAELGLGKLGLAGDLALWMPPSLGPFVGGDVAMGVLATGMLETAGASLLIDFGTNGEILLKTERGYWATATAVGPAFEGGRLTCGAVAGDGVVSSLAYGPEGWRPGYIGGRIGGAGKGIAGAAYIDFLQQGLAAGLLNRRGRFTAGHGGWSAGADGEGPRVMIDQELFVTEGDVAEIMQAKAAAAAGVLALLGEARLQPGDLKMIYVAGGFGYHLDCGHAMEIGLLPKVSPERLRVVGNASLGGASLVLQTGLDDQLEDLCGRCRVVELNQLASFEDHFIDCLELSPIA